MSELLEIETSTAMSEPSNNLLKKLGEAVKCLETETGGLALFGLFERTGAPDRWDVLVATDWVDSETADAIAYVVSKLQQYLSDEDLLSLAGVVTLQASHPLVRQLLTPMVEKHTLGAPLQLENLLLNGIPIDRAWILVADPHSRSRFQPPPYVVERSTSAKAKTAKGQKAAARRKE
jgi:hypothetical protein